jgi:hypothetical protein
MSKLTYQQRKRMPQSQFALPGGRYPVNDLAHARNALSRVSQFGTAAEKSAVRAKVHRKFPKIGHPDPDERLQRHLERGLLIRLMQSRVRR